MINRFEITPPAKSLINGIRAIGYSFPTAVADILDNSISAYAKLIDIYSDPLDNEPYFVILDNGCGMDRNELINAMTFGSDRDGKKESPEDLGRFGLGLKSASLSQCRRFTVISKKGQEINAMAYDLDVIEVTNKWELEELSLDEIIKEPKFEKLKQYESGTLVIWKKFDKIQLNAKNFEESFRNIVSETKKHVELVFHRFYNKVNIYFNTQRIEKRDPFLVNSPKGQVGREVPVVVNGVKILVTPHTLPHANALTTEEKQLLGNPKSIHDDQGFYIYRNERLIIWGSWLHMGYKSELNKLARVQVDIPSSLDSIWMLDVKKSSAKIPDLIKDQIRIAIEDSVFRSHKTSRYQGTKELRENHPVWERIDLRNGNVKYQINRNNPLYTTLSEQIGVQEKILLDELISQLECYIPQGRMINDKYDSIGILNSGDDIEAERLVDQVVNMLRFCSEDTREEALLKILQFEQYKKVESMTDEILRRVDND